MDSPTAAEKTSFSLFGDPEAQLFCTPQTPQLPEPVQFSNDEPLAFDLINTASSASTSQKVSIKAIPEREAIAAPESLPRFSVLVGLKAPSLSEEALQSQHAPIDLVAVLDVSGSMDGLKMDLLKRAVNFVIDNLGPSDRLSIVSFSTEAQRVFPLRRMTQNGREGAKIAVSTLQAGGSTNIVEGLAKGVRVLEERRCENPVSSIIFLSDGLDTCNEPPFRVPYDGTKMGPSYLHLLPKSIRPSNRKTEDEPVVIYPVHAFGFGSDHDPVAMHAISDESGGTFSFIESYEMVQDAFAGCIGGLLSVVVKDLRLVLRSASHGVVIESIDSGRYASEVRGEGFQGSINVGDLYADEEKQFLINLSVPVLQNPEPKTSLLDITCSYKDSVSKEEVIIEADLVEIKRPEILSPEDTVVNLQVDRERNRIIAAQSIAEAQRLADKGDLTGARALLSNRRATILDSVSGQAHDDLSLWLEEEIKEMESRMEDLRMYEKTGRAYALSSMSALDNQRATTRGRKLAVSSVAGASSSGSGFDAYATPQMARMVHKSQMASKAEDESIKE